jgi:hypothetical protein
VRALADTYALPPEAESTALARVHARLVQALASESVPADADVSEAEPRA